MIIRHFDLILSSGTEILHCCSTTNRRVYFGLFYLRVYTTVEIRYYDGVVELGFKSFPRILRM
jgi:hypothetical protein